MEENRNAEPDGLTEVAIDVDPDILRRAQEAGNGVVILPVRMANGKAVYTSSSVLVVKLLKAEGVDAEFLDESSQRVFEEKNSIEVALGAAFVIGIASTAAWDGIKALFRSRRPGKLSVTYLDLEQDEGDHVTGWTVEGESEDVLEAIDRLRK